jgi:hypothetical protein
MYYPHIHQKSDWNKLLRDFQNYISDMPVERLLPVAQDIVSTDSTTYNIYAESDQHLAC